MKILRTPVVCGAEKPFTLLHISDTHLTLADERNDKRKIDLADGRSSCFTSALSDLREAEEYARKNHLTIVHTGDLIDFVSEANLDAAKKFTSGNDVFFSAGNHEFSLYVGEAFEDEAYRNQSLAHVQESFTNDIRFASRVINGVKLIAIDDSYYRFDRPQLEKLKKETEDNLPIILLMHNPVYEPELFRTARPKGDSAYLTSTPDELMSDYSEYRFKQQQADDITIETTEFIKSCPLIKAVFAGHLHYDYEGKLTESIPQYVTGIGTMRLIDIS